MFLRTQNVEPLAAIAAYLNIPTLGLHSTESEDRVIGSTTGHLKARQLYLNGQTLGFRPQTQKKKNVSHFSNEQNHGAVPGRFGLMV